jgi:hypothetical protein
MFNFQHPVPPQISTMALNCLDVRQALQLFLIARESKAQTQIRHSAVVKTKPLFEKTVSTAQRKRVFGRWGDFTVTPHAIN